MNKQNIMVMMTWLRRLRPEHANETTLYNLFVGSFHEQYKVFDGTSAQRIQCDLEAFERYGSIPTYLSRFVRRLFAEMLIHEPKPEGGTLCESAEH